jgi:hypothetical protein
MVGKHDCVLRGVHGTGTRAWKEFVSIYEDITGVKKKNKKCAHIKNSQSNQAKRKRNLYNYTKRKPEMPNLIQYPLVVMGVPVRGSYSFVSSLGASKLNDNVPTDPVSRTGECHSLMRGKKKERRSVRAMSDLRNELFFPYSCLTCSV